MTQVFQSLVGAGMLVRVGVAIGAGSFTAWYMVGGIVGLLLVLSYLVKE